MFSPGELVVCVDASELPDPWLPLTNGKIYIIRGIEEAPSGSTWSNNRHKNAKYVVYLEGLMNIINPVYDKELGYADTRFEKIQPKNDNHVSKNKIESVA